MDNSWYIKLGNLRLLIDPWLEGTEVDYFSWFNTQWHRTSPVSYQDLPEYDAVLITQKYPDHFHIQTLTRLRASRIILPESIHSKARKVFPETQFFPISAKKPYCDFNGVRIECLAKTTHIGPEFHAFQISDGRETAVIAPHGHRLKNLEPIAQGIKLLLSTFNDYRLPYFLGGQLAPGVDGLQKLVEAFRPEFVAATHDEDKYASGLVSKLARIKHPSGKDLSRITALGTNLLNLTDYQRVSI